MVLVTSTYKVLKRLDQAPDFSLRSISGKSYSLRDFGKPVLLVIFICNHCPYVLPKIQYLKKLKVRYMDKGLDVVAINPNDPTHHPEDSFEGMTKTAMEQGFNFPYLHDPTQEVAKKYGAMCTPDPYLFDEQRRLVYHGRIDDAHKQPNENAKSNDLENAIKQVLETGNSSVETMPSMGCSIKWKVGNEPKYFLDKIA
ncbi:MAG: thioredoxin family protein [Candidatus Micrarchaeota archaeon]